MTREEAIKTWLPIIVDSVKTMPELGEALDMAIKALEMLEEFERAQIITGGRLNGRTYAYKCGLEDGKRKALEQQPCEDAISRQAVLGYIEGSDAELGHSSENELVCQDIKEFPPVTPQPKIGRWIKIDILGKYKCSNCENTIWADYPYDWHPYCCQCGSKMIPND